MMDGAIMSAPLMGHVIIEPPGEGAADFVVVLDASPLGNQRPAATADFNLELVAETSGRLAARGVSHFELVIDAELVGEAIHQAEIDFAVVMDATLHGRHVAAGHVDFPLVIDSEMAGQSPPDPGDVPSGTVDFALTFDVDAVGQSRRSGVAELLLVIDWSPAGVVFGVSPWIVARLAGRHKQAIGHESADPGEASYAARIPSASRARHGQAAINRYGWRWDRLHGLTAIPTLIRVRHEVVP